MDVAAGRQRDLRDPRLLKFTRDYFLLLLPRYVSILLFPPLLSG